MAATSDLTSRDEVIRVVLAGLINKAFAVQIQISEQLLSFNLLGSIKDRARTRLTENIYAFSKGPRQRLSNSLAVAR